jgi:hypothetical protein
MASPWLALPDKPPYVLEGDHPHLQAFNRGVGRSSPHYLDLRMFPDPFGGDPRAPLVLLARNPGLGRGDLETHRNNRPFLDALRANIVGDTRQLTYLRDGFRDTPGGRWWRRCVKALMERDDFEADWLSRRILIVDFHAYHARSWRPIPVTLPSQSFGFELVRRAIRRRATIVALRGCADWRVAVPELDGYRGLVNVSNPQVSALSPRNLLDDGYKRVLKALSR